MYIKYTIIANANDSISKAESIHGELLSAFTLQISNFFRPGIFCTYQGSGRQICPQAFRSFPELLGAKKRDHPFKVIGGCIRHVSYSYVSDSSSIRMIRLWSAGTNWSTFWLIIHLYICSIVTFIHSLSQKKRQVKLYCKWFTVHDNILDHSTS